MNLNLNPNNKPLKIINNNYRHRNKYNKQSNIQ